jgi:antitoxin component of MazEF toxin-antitoxin module
MPVKFTLKIAYVGNSLKVTIPKEIATHTTLKKGDIIEMWVDNNHIVIEKKV